LRGQVPSRFSASLTIDRRLITGVQELKDALGHSRAHSSHCGRFSHAHLFVRRWMFDLSDCQWRLASSLD